MRSVQELINLSGRTALVTGGAGHIGSAVANALVSLGASVAIVDRDDDATDAAGQHVQGLSVRCDLEDEQSTRAAVRRVQHELGGLDIFVHAAAFVGTSDVPGWAAPFEEQSADAFRAALEVNLVAAFVIAQEACEALSASNKGSIILISSIYGLVGPDGWLYEGTSMANPAGYGASKGGLQQLTRYLSTTLAPSVRANAISPGGVYRDQPRSFVERYEQRTPLGRMATEEDLVGATVFLASDLSSYVTGHNLVVDGGWTAW